MAAFFPIIAAMCYGLAFAFTEKALKLTNVSTYLLMSGGIGFILAILIMKAKDKGFDFSFIQTKTEALIVAVAVIAPSLGWIFTTFAIRNTSASYAAFAEISYPLFTVLFLFIFFGMRSLDWSILLGGALVIIGSFILVYGQLKN